MPFKVRAARGAAVAWSLAASALFNCASPCTDDGAVWNQDKAGCQSQVDASASASNGSTGAATLTSGPSTVT
jgi:hypothetical protein